jgi:hypothetical protein
MPRRRSGACSQPARGGCGERKAFAHTSPHGRPALSRRAPARRCEEELRGVPPTDGGMAASPNRRGLASKGPSRRETRRRPPAVRITGYASQACRARPAPAAPVIPDLIRDRRFSLLALSRVRRRAMGCAKKILPGTGRWRAEGVTEGSEALWIRCRERGCASAPPPLRGTSPFRGGLWARLLDSPPVPPVPIHPSLREWSRPWALLGEDRIAAAFAPLPEG